MSQASGTQSYLLLVSDASELKSPLPLDTKLSRWKRLPCCIIDDYDRGTFLDYPDRAGWPEARSKPGQPPFLAYSSKLPDAIDVRSLEGFIQAWLFFGMLHEVLGSSIDEARYISTDEQGRALHTENLKEDLDAWAQSAKALPQDEATALSRHLGDCLNLAHDTLMAINNYAPSSFNRDIRQSVTIFLEAVSHTVHSTLSSVTSTAVPNNWTFCYVDTMTLPDMIQNGWCTYKATIALLRFISPSSIRVIESFTDFDSIRDHSGCNRTQCRNLNIDDATYRPSHTMKDCTCRSIAVPVESIGKVLDKGAIPLLRLSGQTVSQMKVHVESSTDNHAFVALSHVWADGLGNTRNTELPSCQLFRLMQSLQKLQGRIHWQSDQPEHRDLLLWCDTLCVPIADAMNEEQSRIHALAMERMRAVYTQAAYVLVLDKNLESLKVSDIGLTEAGLRIMTSSWTFRLWTYQEAVLPKNLLFQFSDILVDLREIWEYHRELRLRNNMLNGICIDIIMWCVQIRLPFHAGDASFMLGIRELTLALRGRSVSYAADEPICLTTILDLDMARMQQVPRNRRMEEFWTMMPGAAKGIPRNIVMDYYPKLTTPGFRWAPSSFLDDPGFYTRVGGLSGSDEAQQGRLTTSGLLVEFPAYRIQRADQLPNISIVPLQTQINTLKRVVLRAGDGSWFGLYLTPISTSLNVDEISEQIVSQDEATILILQTPIGSATQNRYGINWGLVTKESSSRRGQMESGAPTLHSLAYSNLTLLPSHEHIVFSEAYLIVSSVSESNTIEQETPIVPHNREHGDSTMESRPITDPKKTSRKLYNAAKQACQNEQLRQTLLTTGTTNPESYLTFVANRIAEARYLVIQEEFSEDTTWCVD